MKNSIKNIICYYDEKEKLADVTFYFINDPDPYSINEFKKNSKTRNRLEKIEKLLQELSKIEKD